MRQLRFIFKRSMCIMNEEERLAKERERSRLKRERDKERCLNDPEYAAVKKAQRKKYQETQKNKPDFKEKRKQSAKIYSEKLKSDPEKFATQSIKRKERHAERRKAGLLRDRELAAERAYRERNKDNLEYRERLREKGKAYYEKLMSENPEKILVKSANRRAAKAKATVTWADPLKIAEFYKLSKELTEQTNNPHEVDHIIPLRHPLVCGLHNEFNLQVLTESENASKNNRWCIECQGWPCECITD